MSLSFKNMKLAIDVVLKADKVPCIIGLQGVGKSDLVRGYAKEQGCVYRELTCSLLQEGDLAMPYINSSKDVSYAISNIITSLHSEMKETGKKGILFLDEFNRGSSQVQSEMMNLVLQREIVGYKLDKNLMIVLAMNPSSEMEGFENTEYTVSFSDSAILGRVCSLVLNPVLGDWLAYGKTNENGRDAVHPLIRSFLEINRSLFITAEKAGAVNNTPRGWRMASDILYSYEESRVDSIPILKNLLSGVLDSSCVDMLVNHIKANGRRNCDCSQLVSEILEGKSGAIERAYKLLSDVEIDSMFKLIVDRVYELGEVSDEVCDRIVDFILLANKSLSYSWVALISEKYPEFYEGLIQNSVKFSDYVFSLVSLVFKRENGGFSGKQ